WQNTGLRAYGMRQSGCSIDSTQGVDAAQQINRINRPFFDFFFLVIGGADNVVFLEASVSDQRSERGLVVIAFAIPRRLPIHLWCPSEFATAPDQCALEQTVVVQVLQEHC